jgi:hypothetical protein
MGFWSGVVQGVKDIDVLREKEDLAEERQGVRDEAAAAREQDIAYRDRMDTLNAERFAIADARDVQRYEEGRATDLERFTYTQEQDSLAAERAAAALAESRRRDDRDFNWGVETFWIGQDRTDDALEIEMNKWDYNVARDESQDALAATDRETDEERYDFQVERLAQTDLINAAAVAEDGRRFGLAQERLELLDIREQARLDKDDDRYAVANARLERLDAQDVERYDTAQALGAEERSLARGLAIIEAGGSEFGSALGGQGGDVNAGDVISTDNMRAAVMGIEAELDSVGGMDSLSDADKEWFTTVLDNPAAAAGILAFAHAQREDGNDLPITELPQIIQLAGTLEAAGEDAYKAFRERFIAGNVDMADPAQFLEGMQALRGYKPAQVVWGQVQAVDTPATQKLDFETWEANTTLYARVALANMADGSEKTALATTLVNAGKTGSEHQLTRNDAFVSLWEDYGRPAAEEMGIDSANPRMRPYFSIRSPMSDAQPTGAFNAPQSPQVPVTPGAVSRPSTQAPIEPQAIPSNGPMSFDTVDEARATIDSLTPEQLSRIPEIVIAGEVRKNDAYVGDPEAPAGLDMTEAPVVAEEGPPSRTPRMEGVTSNTEELRAGAEAVANGLTGGMGEEELDSLISELEGKFGREALQYALSEAPGLADAYGGSNSSGRNLNGVVENTEELKAGAEAIAAGITGGMDQAELDSLVTRLQDKFGVEALRDALSETSYSFRPNQ